MNELENMANSLRLLRTGAGYTQSQIAEMLGVNKTTVLRWESGESVPDTRTILWYADRFDVSLDTIFGRRRTISGNFKDLIAREVGDAITETMKPGGPVYDELLKEINGIVEIYELRENKEV